MGEGSTCCVYEGWDAERNKKVRLKELYPVGAQVRRVGQELRWKDQQERDAMVRRFEEAAAVQMGLANAEQTGNSTVHSDGIYDGNGTKYLIMDVDFGKTFDRDDSEDIHDILQSILALIRAVKACHQAGFLHLDLKPENFLIVPETRELVKIFDTDTMIRKEDLRTAPQCSYTQKWAAPEQRLGRRSRICEATDFYAIGGILFNRVMGRMPGDEDTAPFADWKLDGPVFEGVNPAVKPKLKEFFRRTLASAVKHRWQRAEDLETALQKMIQITEGGRLYLVSDCPQVGKVIGRFGELTRIDREFESGKRAVFLHGFGGIGKTTLALKYADNWRDVRYDAVVLLRYSAGRSLEECLWDLPICAYSDEGISEPAKDRQRFQTLRKICTDERCLFILDNFDTNDSAQDDVLNKLLCLQADFLITTRNDHSYFQQAAQLEVECLDDASLLNVFELNVFGLNSDRTFSEEEGKAVLRMLHTLEGNTLFTVLLAKQLKASGVSVGILSENLFAQEEKVRLDRGGTTYKLTQREWLKTIWDAGDLGEKKRETLQNVWLLQAMELDKQAYKELTGARSLDDLNDLIDGSWICYGDPYRKENPYSGKRTLYLHPLVEELVQFELEPQCRSCGELAKWFDILLADERSFSREDILVPKHILHALAKWLSVEDREDERKRIFRRICEILEKQFVSSDDDQVIARHSFDERFPPDALFAPLLKTGSDEMAYSLSCLTETAPEALDAGKLWNQLSRYTLKTMMKDRPFAAWGRHHGHLGAYLNALSKQIRLQFLFIRMLDAYSEQMNEWGIWSWDDEEWQEEKPGTAAPWNVNYDGIVKTVNSAAQNIAEFDRITQHYFQTYYPPEEVRKLLRNKIILDTPPFIWPEHVIQWHWPVIRFWGDMLNQRNSLSGCITRDVGALHSAMYRMMCHTLERFEDYFADPSERPDSWGDYEELAASLVGFISDCAWRMEESCLESANISEKASRIVLRLGYRQRTKEELLSFQIPEFPLL